MHPLAERVKDGDKRAAARAMTWVENGTAEGRQVLSDLFPHTGRAYVVGITGSPGSGKSSLTDAWVSLLRQDGCRVGIVAVDPTSPFTGGALLGDRVRMNHHATDPGVFIRSMGTRGALGGVARATREFVHILDAYGCDYIFVETVGVGQSETDILHLADTVALVLNPGAGDQIQSLKAGVMEIADIYIVNKADFPGADKTVQEVETLLDLIHDFAFRPPVVKTAVAEQATVRQAWTDIALHRKFLETSGQLAARRSARHVSEVVSLAMQSVKEGIDGLLNDRQQFEMPLQLMASGQAAPYEIAQQILQAYARQLLAAKKAGGEG